MSIQEDALQIGRQALAASRVLATLTSRKKNAILEAMATELEAQRDAISAANKIDVEEARKKGTAPALVDRLELTPPRFDSMVKGIRDVTVLKDPVGEKISKWIRPNGLEIHKVRVPIGVICIIYESRPNVTADAACLCFKTSNAVILKGGSEALQSNLAIARAMQQGGEKKGLPPNSIQLVATTNRAIVKELVTLDQYVDLVIPRGGEGLIHSVTQMATVPVIKHYKGVCHAFVDVGTDLAMALDIVENAKCQRPSACNALECVLVHKDEAAKFLPDLARRMAARNTRLKGDEAARAVVPAMEEAKDEDYYQEYLDYILNVKVVDHIDAAIAHINKYGSRHSDAILSNNESHQKQFLQEVDSAAVYVNASTRFTDGAEFGLGAEIGISTDKLHARGPMGLEELTTYKFQVYGKGQVRQ
jgi:glutamate-5-semialdehyde dehydrogenase